MCIVCHSFAIICFKLLLEFRQSKSMNVQNSSTVNHGRISGAPGNATASDLSEDDGGNRYKAMIALGIAAAVLAVIMLFAMAACLISKRKRKKTFEDAKARLRKESKLTLTLVRKKDEGPSEGSADADDAGSKEAFPTKKIVPSDDRLVRERSKRSHKTSDPGSGLTAQMHAANYADYLKSKTNVKLPPNRDVIGESDSANRDSDIESSAISGISLGIEMMINKVPLRTMQKQTKIDRPLESDAKAENAYFCQRLARENYDVVVESIHRTHQTALNIPVFAKNTSFDDVSDGPTSSISENQFQTEKIDVAFRTTLDKDEAEKNEQADVFHDKNAEDNSRSIPKSNLSRSENSEYLKTMITEKAQSIRPVDGPNYSEFHSILTTQSHQKDTSGSATINCYKGTSFETCSEANTNHSEAKNIAECDSSYNVPSLHEHLSETNLVTVTSKLSTQQSYPKIANSISAGTGGIGDTNEECTNVSTESKTPTELINGSPKIYNQTSLENEECLSIDGKPVQSERSDFSNDSCYLTINPVFSNKSRNFPEGSVDQTGENGSLAPLSVKTGTCLLYSGKPVTESDSGILMDAPGFEDPAKNLLDAPKHPRISQHCNMFQPYEMIDQSAFDRLYNKSLSTIEENSPSTSCCSDEFSHDDNRVASFISAQHFRTIIPANDNSNFLDSLSNKGDCGDMVPKLYDAVRNDDSDKYVPEDFDRYNQGDNVILDGGTVQEME